ncbi:hypothetical protein [Chitinophaga nivalis]|uniref:Glycosyltransferase RgtA/B/C/D-like domain-containing protein n=1 Tax=Chitinophaga nivalis TaxID=2991709 RepID=A0ABT3IL11_9BACT|nr:hypothetical protein [Chitinophaga nivalis]MCW3465660.1 hypothetical protein [Chitinophaga nivalis]MCW3484649.1 hypothetical protein [Chitinophaga nivalis]
MSASPYSTTDLSFPAFIRQHALHRNLLLGAIAGAIVQLMLFKWIYPFADYFSDSYNYIESASYDMSVNIWPVGYARVLQGFHLFTRSDTAVVASQYFFIVLTGLYFFFTLLYFYRPAKPVLYTLYIFLFFNPLMLYLSNYITSDPVFLALSLLWFTQLLWMLNRPALFRLLTHGVLLAIAFTVRYNAMYYPLVTAAILLLSRYPVWAKLAGIGLPVCLIYLFINFTSQQNYKHTGARQFSVFSGWQLANNALYMYPYITVDATAIPPGCEAFDRQVRQYFETAPEEYKKVTPVDGAFYIKYPSAPLKSYLVQNAQAHKIEDGLRQWGSVAPVFAAYGTWLIKSHPVSYFRYFILQNARVYILPPLEKLEVYNMNSSEVWSPAKEWFEYKSNEVKAAVSPTFQGRLLFFFPTLFLILNVVFAGALVYFVVKKGWQKAERSFNLLLLASGFLWLVNMGFSILASPIVFRYQVFPMIVCLAVGGMLLAFLDKHEKIFEGN